MEMMKRVRRMNKRLMRMVIMVITLDIYHKRRSMNICCIRILKLIKDVYLCHIISLDFRSVLIRLTSWLLSFRRERKLCSLEIYPNLLKKVLRFQWKFNNWDNYYSFCLNVTIWNISKMIPKIKLMIC